MQRQRGFSYKQIVYFLLIIVCGFITIKRICVGCDVDEMAAYAQAFRIVRGDIFFKDIWEAQMTSGIVLAGIIKLWMIVSGGTTGVVLFTRICSVVLQLAMAGFVYKSLELLQINKNGRTCLAVVFYLYCTKKMIIPDYGNLQNWLPVLILFCMLHFWKGNRKNYWLVIVGLLYSLLVLAYPTYIFLLAAYLPGIIILERSQTNSYKKILLEVGVIAGTCLLCATMFLVWILHGQTWGELMENITRMSNMSGYEVSFASKLSTFKTQFGAEANVWIKIAFVSIPVFGVCYAIARNRIQVSKSILYLECFLFVDLMWETVCCIQKNSDWNLRYIIILVLLGLLRWKQNDRILLWFGIMPGVFGYLATIIVSAIGIVGGYRVLFCGAYAALIGMALSWDELRERLQIYAVCVYLLFCTSVFIRVSNKPQNIFEYQYKIVAEGPLKGILFQPIEAENYNSLLDITEEYMQDDDKLCYIGMNDIIYLMREGALEVATPSVVWNDWNVAPQFIDYYKVNEAKLPDTVVYNKKYSFSVVTTIDMEKSIDIGILDWVRNNYHIVYQNEWVEVYQ